MKTRLSILFASTALTFALGHPALAAMQSSGNATGFCGSDVCIMRFGDGDQTIPLIRVSDDDDDDDGGWFRWGHDDDDECDDDEGKDCGAASGKGNAAPAGTMAPPANGLFGNGAPPVAVTN